MSCCVEDAVGGLGFSALVAVVGGVEMPFGRSFAAAGEAMVDLCLSWVE